MHWLCGQTIVHFLPCIVLNQYSVLGFNTMVFIFQLLFFLCYYPVYSASHHNINNSLSSHKNNSAIAELISTFQYF